MNRPWVGNPVYTAWIQIKMTTPTSGFQKIMICLADEFCCINLLKKALTKRLPFYCLGEKRIPLPFSPKEFRQ
jgi:hypothetical protein